MECFIVRARLRTPFALTGGYLTLDSLLAARVFDMTGDLKAAHEGLPLRATNGLYHASAALAEASAPGKLSVVAGLRAAHDLTADMLMKNKLGKVHAQIGLKRRRQFGNVTSQFRIVPTDSVAWYGEGGHCNGRGMFSGAPLGAATRILGGHCNFGNVAKPPPAGAATRISGGYCNVRVAEGRYSLGAATRIRVVIATLM